MEYGTAVAFFASFVSATTGHDQAHALRDIVKAWMHGFTRKAAMMSKRDSLVAVHGLSSVCDYSPWLKAGGGSSTTNPARHILPEYGQVRALLHMEAAEEAGFDGLLVGIALEQIGLRAVLLDQHGLVLVQKTETNTNAQRLPLFGKIHDLPVTDVPFGDEDAVGTWGEDGDRGLEDLAGGFPKRSALGRAELPRRPRAIVQPTRLSGRCATPARTFDLAVVNPVVGAEDLARAGVGRRGDDTIHLLLEQRGQLPAIPAQQERLAEARNMPVALGPEGYICFRQLMKFCL